MTILSVDVDSNAPSNVTYIQLENVYNTLYDNPAESNDITKRSLQVGVSALLSVYKFYSLGCKGELMKSLRIHLISKKSFSLNRSNHITGNANPVQLSR